MCDAATIITILTDYGPADIHRLSRLIHASNCSVTYMASHLVELIREGRVAVSVGQYAIADERGNFPVVPLCKPERAAA